MDVTIRERRLEDDKAIVQIRNENQPHLPPSTVERYRYQADPKLIPEGGIDLRYVAVLDGEVVGISTLGGNWDYQRPNTFNGSVIVCRRLQDEGIGKKLYDYLMEQAAIHGVDRIYGSITEGDGRSMEFARHRGFKPDGRVDRLSRLDTEEVNFEGYEDDIASRLAADGIEIKTLADVELTDEFLHKLHDALYVLDRDIPSAEEWSQAPFGNFRESIFNRPDTSLSLQWVALHEGNPVSYAMLRVRGSDVGFNGMTGTLPEFRGKGLARALKRRQIEWARNNGIRWIFTANDMENHRMLAINIRLGYQPVPSEIEVVKDLGD